MPPIALLSSDLNGTLVHPHTMQEMIRLAFPHEPQRYEKAKKAFTLQIEGRLHMEEAFRIAAEQSRGLPLRVAIDYVTDHMSFVDGYALFADFLLRKKIRLAIISTAYSVTLYAMRHGTPTPPFLFRCNRLVFSDDTGHALSEEALESLVKIYLQDPHAREGKQYDRIRADGKVELGIKNERDKAGLALEIADSLDIPQDRVAHVGDTMGDSGGILGVAQAGGLGIAFNYNQALHRFVMEHASDEMREGRVFLVDPKGPTSNLAHVIEILEGGDRRAL